VNNWSILLTYFIFAVLEKKGLEGLEGIKGKNGRLRKGEDENRRR